MTWKSHRILTATSVFALTHSIPIAIVAMCGAIFPDKIEYFIYGSGGQEWQNHHRKFSHWFLPYALFCLSVYAFLKYKNMFFLSFEKLHQIMLYTDTVTVFGILIVLLNLSFWYFIGALFHLAEDVFCGGIPILSPNKRVKFFRLFYVNSTREFIISYGLSILLIFYSTNSSKMLWYWGKHILYGIIR